MLPSGHVIDRSTIMKHLLNRQTNPFTNETLLTQQLVPLPKLKLSIQEFLKKMDSSNIENKRTKRDL